MVLVELQIFLRHRNNNGCKYDDKYFSSVIYLYIIGTHVSACFDGQQQHGMAVNLIFGRKVKTINPSRTLL